MHFFMRSLLILIAVTLLAASAKQMLVLGVFDNPEILKEQSILLLQSAVALFMLKTGVAKRRDSY